MRGGIFHSGFVSLLFSFVSVVARAEWTVYPEVYPEPCVTVDVPSGETNSLASLLSAQGAADLSQLAAIVKTGSGLLVSDQAIHTFTGTVFVAEGTFSARVTGALGTNGCWTCVKDGATVEFREVDETKEHSLYFTENHLLVSGTGVDGKGALAKYGKGSQIYVWPTVYLAGDARLFLQSGRGDFQSYWPNGVNVRADLHLNGHTLTVKASGGNVVLSGTRVSPGNIFVESGQILIQGVVRFEGGPENTLTLAKDGRIQFWGDTAQGEWTLITEEGASLEAGNGQNQSNKNNWNMPLVLNGDLRTRRYLSWGGLSLVGPVSGPYGIRCLNDKMSLHLVNGSNTFTGPVSFPAQNYLYLYENGALPEASAGLYATNSSVVFKNFEMYQLPPASFHGTGTVFFAQGAWRDRLLKTGEGCLEYKSLVSSKLLDLREGTIRLSGSGYLNPGLWEGVQYFSTSDKTTEAFLSTVCPSNAVTFGVDAALMNGTAPPSPWRDQTVVTYSGYLWNRTDETVTWSFAGSIDDTMRLILDGKVYDWTAWQEVATYTVSLEPGPHSFEVRLNNYYGGAGASEAQGKWKKNFGFVYDPLGRGTTNAADYVVLRDEGDGKIFTRTIDSFQNLLRPIFDTVRCAEGTTLDLAGMSWETASLEGCPSVTNGDFTVINWTVTATALAAGQTLLVEDHLIFPDGATLSVGDLSTLTRAGEGTLLCRAKKGVQGVPRLLQSEPVDTRWTVRKDSETDLRIVYKEGLQIILR